MSHQYRTSRDLEASIIDFIIEKLTETGSSWANVHVEKSFARAYEINLPTICIRCGITIHNKAEIGGDATIREPSIWIDLFANSDGQRLDLKDWLIETLKHGLPYYEYTIENGVISDKTENGRIRIIRIEDEPIDFDTPKDKLDPHDRYRHLLTLTISLGRVEA
jgi:hypothetical protein